MGHLVERVLPLAVWSLCLMQPQMIEGGSRRSSTDATEQSTFEQRRLRKKIRRLELKKQQLQRSVARKREALSPVSKGRIEVWHHCDIALKEVDGQLDRGYIERMFRSYLSGVAAMIKSEDKTGIYEIEGTIGTDGSMIEVAVTEDSFQSETLKDRIIALLSSLNYGTNKEGSEVKIILVISRDMR